MHLFVNKSQKSARKELEGRKFMILLRRDSLLLFVSAVRKKPKTFIRRNTVRVLIDTFEYQAHML